MIIEGYQIKGIEKYVSRFPRRLKWKIHFSFDLENWVSFCLSNKNFQEHSLIISHANWVYDRTNVLTKLLSRAYLAEQVGCVFAYPCVKSNRGIAENVGFTMMAILDNLSEVWSNDIRNHYWPNLAVQEKISFPKSPLGKKILQPPSATSPFFSLLAFSFYASWKRFFGESPLSFRDASNSLGETRLGEIYAELPRLTAYFKENQKNFLETANKILTFLGMPFKVSTAENENWWEIIEKPRF